MSASVVTGITPTDSVNAAQKQLSEITEVKPVPVSVAHLLVRACR